MCYTGADILEAFASTPELPLIETLLLREGMQAEDILTVLLDMVLIGANAVCYNLHVE